MINRNANWTRSQPGGPPTLTRGDWVIVQVDVAEYVLCISGYSRVHARCKTLDEIQTLTEEFVSSECKGSWLKRDLPKWLQLEATTVPWVQTQLP